MSSKAGAYTPYQVVQPVCCAVGTQTIGCWGLQNGSSASSSTFVVPRRSFFKERCWYTRSKELRYNSLIHRHIQQHHRPTNRRYGPGRRQEKLKHWRFRKKTGNQIFSQPMAETPTFIWQRLRDVGVDYQMILRERRQWLLMQVM